jgi:hypothetical protein
MSALNKYVKPRSLPPAIKSVAIRQDQANFIQQNNLNLSQIVRDAIDQLMKETAK